jgi:cell division protein FtsI (penicillin-binding protein 3)
VTEQFNIHLDEEQNERKRPRNESVTRIYILIVFFLAAFAIVGVRLFMIQVIESDKLKDIAKVQYESRDVLKPTRGLILDRNLSILASNITEFSVAVDPQVLENPDSIINELARVLPGSYPGYRNMIRNTKRRNIILEKGVKEETIAKIKEWDCYGIKIKPREKRKYNFSSLAGPVIGYTNVENKGQSGIELAMEKSLAGKDGFIVYQLNAKRYKRPEVEYPHKDPVNGNSVVLTINQAYQAIVEEELAKGVELYSAESGRCIIMQPKTGEILAMANNPSMDPNNRAEYSPEKARNRVITDLYEPGSTFKIVTMSAALNEGIYKAEDEIFAENGVYYHTPKEKPIVDAHPYAYLSLRGAFEHSSNIVSAKIAKKMGSDLFYKYARNFGFGIKTGIELPGEMRGDLRNPVDWDGTTHLYMAFGYSLAATSLQIACAYSAIANDGVLMRPYIRKWLLDQNRNIVDETVPQTVRRVVESETATTMREFMRGAVDSGTASKAKIAGMSIGGKTGTSQRLVNGSYSNKSHVASFVGFFPIEDPKILILIILDSPTNGYYGGQVAAPIFREIAMRVMNSSGEFSKEPDPVKNPAFVRNTITIPDLRGFKLEDAQEIAEAAGLKLLCQSSKGVVIGQEPSAGHIEKSNTSITVRTLDKSDEKMRSKQRLPNLAGLTIRQAMNVINELGLKVKIEGSGIVRNQSPEPGTVVNTAGLCHIVCRPRNLNQVNVY